MFPRAVWCRKSGGRGGRWATRMNEWIVWEVEETVARSRSIMSLFSLFATIVQGSHTPSLTHSAPLSSGEAPVFFPISFSFVFVGNSRVLGNNVDDKCMTNISCMSNAAAIPY